jgi:hypothetical protein
MCRVAEHGITHSTLSTKIARLLVRCLDEAA